MYNKALLQNKLDKAGDVILCNNKAKNVGIAEAMTRLFNAVSVQKNKSEWSSYFVTMPKIFSRSIIPFFTLVLFCNPVAYIFGQDLPENEEITVIASHQPEVPEAFKIIINPELPVEKVSKPTFTYNIINKEFLDKVKVEPIVPARVRGESATKLYKNLIKAGFGNYTTPYFEFYANQLRSEKSAFGVHLNHLSSSGKIKEYAHPGYSNSLAELYAKKFFNSHTLSADAGYSRDIVHYYGFKPENFPQLEYSKKDIRQIYNKVG
ncbi:MAG: hypothetical protein K8R53_10355, partial [Bacteroidales bacterium]|nr:hypothetical protein [Bacteroidales bacterium]